MRAEYIDHMGSDLTVVNAARVSFNKESEWERVYHLTNTDNDRLVRELSDKDVGLISYLARNNHWTPFSHCVITMREKVPIFVARQRFKHTVGFSYNEVSRRYVDDAPEFFVPSVWRKRAENKKQGSSDESVTQWTDWYDGYEGRMTGTHVYNNVMRSVLDLYEYLLDNGVAPEQARMVLPQSMYTEYYVTGSLAAWARAYKLRNESHAQKEIQDLSNQWNDIIAPLFPLSWSALVEG